MRPLLVSIKKCTQIVLVCCKLHYLIIDEGWTSNVPENIEANVDGTFMDVVMQDGCVLLHIRQRDLESCTLREIFTDLITENDMFLPN